jgi:hypothetical protein
VKSNVEMLATKPLHVYRPPTKGEIIVLRLGGLLRKNPQILN